jgi:hypothetical protein
VIIRDKQLDDRMAGLTVLPKLLGKRLVARCPQVKRRHRSSAQRKRLAKSE